MMEEMLVIYYNYVVFFEIKRIEVNCLINNLYNVEMNYF